MILIFLYIGELMAVYFQQQTSLIFNDMSSQQGSIASFQTPDNNQDSFLQKKLEKLLDKHPDISPEKAFHLQFCKLYLENMRLNFEVKQTKDTIINLQHQLQHLTRDSNSFRNHTKNHNQNHHNSEKQRRMRRTANEIARHYVCPHYNCMKSYGSQGSLNQHIKLKH